MKKWIVREPLTKKSIYGNEILDELLVSRGITQKDAADEFLRAPISNLYNPFLMKDMSEAVERIDSAVKKSEKVTIYGDYDVDGIISTSILYRALKKLGVDVGYYIPDRMNEGYGMNIKAIDYIKALATDLIITVDCGITSIEEVYYIKSNNMDVIVTDHHECKEQIPNTIVLNPKRHDCKYPYKFLAGCGVVFKLVQALWLKYGLEGFEEFLDLAAIGTVADVVELTGENRVIVKNGLGKLNNSKKCGIQAIKNISGIADNVTSSNIAFQMAPRINAAGRLNDAKIAVELFTTRDNDKAMQIAKFLDQENKKRQEIEDEILNEGIIKINQEINLKKDRVIVLSSQNWHAGVVGIVASRILERYRRPVLLICEEGQSGRGSARSIEGFNIFEALCECSDLLNKFGGHEMAAGVSIDIKNIPELKRRLNNEAMKVEADCFIDKLNIDMIINEKDLDINTADLIKSFEPYGNGNPSPVFCLRNVNVLSKRTIGNSGQHLKYQLSKSGFNLDGVFFKAGKQIIEQEWDQIDAAFNIDINEWNNTKKVQLIIKDIKPCSLLIKKNVNNYYYRSLKKAVGNNIEEYDLKNIYFIKKSHDFLKDFIVFNRGYILVTSPRSLSEIEDMIDLCSLSFNCNVGTESQIIINPDLNNIDFENNEILIYDFLPGCESYKKLSQKVKNGIYNFYSDDTIDKIDLFANEIMLDKNLIFKMWQDIVYNEIIGTINDISVSYNSNPYQMYRNINFLKENGFVNVLVKESILKIKPKNISAANNKLFNGANNIDDIQYNKINNIKNIIKSFLGEE